MTGADPVGAAGHPHRAGDTAPSTPARSPGTCSRPGLAVRVVAEEAADLDLPGLSPVDGPAAAVGVEMVFALGGDGTLLRAAELARPAVPRCWGSTSARSGSSPRRRSTTLTRWWTTVVARPLHGGRAADPGCHRRADGATVAESWALNEISVEKGAREKMLELMVDVDGRPLSRYGCDGVVCATPTGSTAYAFSAGGPVVWPEVEAMLLVPISAHALFSRPLVTAPTSTVVITVDPYAPGRC
jgi:NAD+ kinase